MTPQEQGRALMMQMAKALESAHGVNNGIVVDAIFNLLVGVISYDATDDEARRDFEHYGHALLTLSAKDGDVN